MHKVGGTIVVFALRLIRVREARRQGAFRLIRLDERTASGEKRREEGPSRIFLPEIFSGIDQFVETSTSVGGQRLRTEEDAAARSLVVFFFIKHRRDCSSQRRALHKAGCRDATVAISGQRRFGRDPFGGTAAVLHQHRSLVRHDVSAITFSIQESSISAQFIPSWSLDLFLPYWGGADSAHTTYD